MLARYYSSSLGRFMAVDPGDDTDPEDPQSWNKYAYVRNNPLKSIDPKGTEGVGIPTSPQQLQQMTNTAIVQQAEPQGKAMEAAAQAETLERAGTVVCEGAPIIGDAAGAVTTGLVIAAPFTGGATVPAATTTGLVAAAGHGAAFVCDPASPAAAAAVVADVIGQSATAATVRALAPSIGAAARTAGALTGEVMSATAKPAVTKTLELACP